MPPDRLIELRRICSQWAEENEIDEIVVAMDDRRQGFPLHEFLECRLAGIQLLELPSFLERETGKVHLEILNPSWIIFGDGFRVSQLQCPLERVVRHRGEFAAAGAGAAGDAAGGRAIRLEDGSRRPCCTGRRGSASTAQPST